MIYIIDGTGPDSESDYELDMNRGFCRSISQQNGDNAIYKRGPTLVGLGTWGIGDEVLKIITMDDKKGPIVLIGHSRGGAICMYVARKLKDKRIPVAAMLLLDAVRRSPPRAASTAIGQIKNMYVEENNLEIDVISSNVAKTLHLIRDEKFSNYFINTKEYKALKNKVGEEKTHSYPSATNKGPKPLLGDEWRLHELTEYHRQMRNACRFDCIVGEVSTGFSFGNTGLKAEPGSSLTVEKYQATHGGMGGAPLDVTTYISDARYAADIIRIEQGAMKAIETRCSGFLKEIPLR